MAAVESASLPIGSEESYYDDETFMATLDELCDNVCVRPSNHACQEKEEHNNHLPVVDISGIESPPPMCDAITHFDPVRQGFTIWHNDLQEPDATDVLPGYDFTQVGPGSATAAPLGDATTHLDEIIQGSTSEYSSFQQNIELPGAAVDATSSALLSSDLLNVCNATSPTNSPLASDHNRSSSSSGEENERQLISTRRKRILGMADRDLNSSRDENKMKRLKGESYVGYQRKKKDTSRVMVHNVPKPARAIGDRCSSRKCMEWAGRRCQEVTEGARRRLFTAFWNESMDWNAKKILIASLVDQTLPKQRTKKNLKRPVSMRSHSYFYHLKVDDQRIPVCQAMFLNTFGLKNSTVRHWLKHYSLIGSSQAQAELDNNNSHQEELQGPDDPANTAANSPEERLVLNQNRAAHSNSSRSVKLIKQRNEHLDDFLDVVPKLPSHYCRMSTSKLYLQSDIISMSQFHQIYSSKCKDDGILPLSRWAFDKRCQLRNISIFSPKKDQCDLCFKQKHQNIEDEKYSRHIALKNAAREEKAKDKQLAEDGQVYSLCCDVMAVKLLPHIQASASYYKMKLAIHNYTIYNLGDHDALCVWFTENEGNLVASSFATLLTEEIERMLSRGKRDVIIYSDGCTNQNRNVVLANALLSLSVEKDIFIYQKFLEKGHTQMEGDSVHSVIEGALKQQEIYLPHELVALTKKARSKPQPYRSRLAYHNEFKDFTNIRRYRSIRPGNKPNEPTVTDLRVLQYDPSGIIRFKLRFEDEFQDLPRRSARTSDQNPPPSLHQYPLPIPKDKWDDLQSLKLLMPRECHNFYDTLPHSEASLRKAKRNKEQ